MYGGRDEVAINVCTLPEVVYIWLRLARWPESVVEVGGALVPRAGAVADLRSRATV